MYSLVICNISFSDKTFVTLIALIWFLSSVCCLVPHKTTIYSKTGVTLIALIWFLTSVSQLVCYKITFQSKTFITLTALMWFLPSMYSLVICKISFRGKIFVTLNTLGLLSAEVLITSLSKAKVLVNSCTSSYAVSERMAFRRFVHITRNSCCYESF